jgi:hypothetical protein
MLLSLLAYKYSSLLTDDAGTEQKDIDEFNCF